VKIDQVVKDHRRFAAEARRSRVRRSLARPGVRVECGSPGSSRRTGRSARCPGSVRSRQGSPRRGA